MSYEDYCKIEGLEMLLAEKSIFLNQTHSRRIRLPGAKRTLRTLPDWSILNVNKTTHNVSSVYLKQKEPMILVEYRLFSIIYFLLLY